MTANHHTDIATGASANAAIINSPLGELDAAITAINFTYSGIGTEYLDGNGNFSVPVGTGSSIDGHVITDEGGAGLTQRSKLDFIGASVIASNGVSATEVEINGAKLSMNTEALSAAKTLTDASEPIQYLDPGGASRDVNLPAEASTNPFFIIVNRADAAENLAVKDDSPATIITINQNETGILVSDGVAWTGYIVTDGSGSFLSNIVEDITPQLGGNLDMNAKNIEGVSPTEMAYLIGVTSAIQTQLNAKMENIVDDTAPQLGGQLDVNGQALGDGTLEILEFGEVGSAINHLKVTNAAAGNAPELSAVGDDTNVDLKLTGKGAGIVKAGSNFNGDTKTLYGFEGEINAQTGTTYTLLSSDNGKIVTLNNASAITLTVGSALPAGFNCLLIQKGAGQVTVAAGGTGNVRNRSSHTKIAGQYGLATVFIESNAGTAPEVYLAGDTAS